MEQSQEHRTTEAARNLAKVQRFMQKTENPEPWHRRHPKCDAASGLVLLFFFGLIVLRNGACAQTVTPNVCVDPDGTMDFVQDVYTISNCSIAGLAVNMSICQAANFLNLTTCSPGGTLRFPVWPDADGDGQGSKTANATFVCTVPAGYVTNNLDCNDADATIFQGSYVCQSLNPVNLATLWPPAFNFSNKLNIGCQGTSAKQWGNQVSVSNTGSLLFTSSQCYGYGMVWRYDTWHDLWVPETGFVFDTQDNGTTRLFGASNGITDDYIIASQEEVTPGTTVNAFLLFKRNGVNSWTQLNVTTTVVTDQRSNLNTPQVSAGKTPGGTTVTAACSSSLASGNTAAELGVLNGTTYTGYTLCGACTVPGVCPINWNIVTGGIDFCLGTNGIRVGMMVAIDAKDGLRAVVTDFLNRLYWFTFDDTAKLWTWVAATPASPWGIDTFNWTLGLPPSSLAMYNGLTAFAVSSGTPTSPAPTFNASACSNQFVGYVRYMTWNGATTWSLQPNQLVSPWACGGDNCGWGVAVRKGNKIVAGCPQLIISQGSAASGAFGYAVEWYVGAQVDSRYPESTALYEAPAEQRGTGIQDGFTLLSTDQFGMSVAATDRYLAFSSVAPGANGYSGTGRVWVTRCTNVTTCFG